MDMFLVSKGEKRTIRWVIYGLGLLFLFPIVSAIYNSLKYEGFENYIFVFTHKINGISVLSTFWNSLQIAVGHAFFVLLVGSLAGYAFSKIEFAGKEIVYIGVLMCLAIPLVVMIVPFFYIFQNLGLYNHLLAVVCSEVAMTLPFAVLFFRNFYDSLPKELMESATIDGANVFQAFSKVYLPLARSALINLGVLCVMWSFQDFLAPLMFLTDKDLATTNVAINNLKGAFGLSPGNVGKFNAFLVVLGIPALVLFLVAQKFITQGITSGALKD
ncbi:carbohydrate ABC transporter permease [Cohnella silvisoli]|uniref:Carbohydrate ABC transporter permease n=1 Tax=Cohnella silvisoli TaxID=2873699 RepID=A0ABV1L1H8_9BACL|nr:carbohydrate ABC transporter permease [Cohnella silvisoli]MCD9024908.1 carbohydrate ABC transporter permease [Cohnella silvisoli]